MSHLDLLKAHLNRETPGADWVIKTICDDVPGWSFFKGYRKDTRGGRTVQWAIHDETGVMRREPEALLADVYRSLAPHQKPEAHSPEVLARAAVCLLHDGGGLLTTKRINAFEKKFGLEGLFEPRVKREEGRIEIEFLVHEQRQEISRYRVVIDDRYWVTHESEAFGPSSKR